MLQEQMKQRFGLVTGQVLLSWILSVAPGVASDLVRIPKAQCEPVYTFQMNDCSLERVSRCSVDGSEVVQHVSVDKGDLDFVTQYNSEYDTVFAFEEYSEVVFAAVIDNRDPLSITNILENGFDTVDQTVLMNIPPFLDPSPIDLAMEYRLTGEIQSFSDVSFKQGKFSADLVFQKNALRLKVLGEFFVDPKTNTMVEGETFIELYGSSTLDHASPIRVMLPGDPDFYDDTLAYQCDQLSQGTSLSSLAKG